MDLPAQPNQSLIDGLQCLYHVLGAGQPVGSRELARMLNAEPTRINRMLKTLCAMEYLQQDEHKRYFPGAAVHLLSAVSLQGSGLLTRALPEIDALMKQTGHSAALGVLWNQHVCYLFHGTPNTPLNNAIGRHGPFLVTISSIGKVLLAQRGREEWIKAAETGGVALPLLQQELKNTQTSGYAIDNSSRPGSIAVCVGHPVVAGLALMHSPHDADFLIGKLLPPLQEAAVRITAALQAPQNNETPPILPQSFALPTPSPERTI